MTHLGNMEEQSLKCLAGVKKLMKTKAFTLIEVSTELRAYCNQIICVRLNP